MTEVERATQLNLANLVINIDALSRSSVIWRDWLRHENMHHQLDAFARECECNFESPPKDEMWFCNKRVPNPKVGMIMHHLCGQKIKVFYVSNNWQYFVESLRSRLCPNCNQGHWFV